MASADIKNDDSLSMKMTCYGIRKRFSKVAQLSTEQLATWIDGGKPVTLLDARPESEFRISKLPGATRVDPEDLAKGIADAEQVINATPADQPVVLYCSVGYRSSMVAEKLMQSENSDAKRPIYNLEGSIFKWANENRSIVDSQGSPTQLVHPYNSFFGKLLDSNRRYQPSDSTSNM